MKRTLSAGITSFGLVAFSGVSLAATIDVASQPEFKEFTEKMSPEAALLAAALFDINMGQYEQAIAGLRVLSKDKPEAATLWGLLAVAYNQVDDALGAYDAASKAVALSPKNYPYQLERGVAAYRLRKFTEAEQSFSNYLLSNPKNARARLYLALSRAELGRPAEAREELVRVRSLEPGLSAQADYYIGLMDAQLGKLPQAGANLRRALTAFKEDAVAKRKVELKLAEVERRDAAQTSERQEKVFVSVDAKNAAKSTPRPRGAS